MKATIWYQVYQVGKDEDVSECIALCKNSKLAFAIAQEDKRYKVRAVKELNTWFIEVIGQSEEIRL